MYVTLAEIKEHLIIEHDLDDNYLTQLESAAEDAAAKLINQELSATLVDGNLPPSLKMLLLQFIGNWYANREPVAYASTSEVPYTVRFLADLNRKY